MIIISAVVLVLAVIAYMGHRATVNDVVEKFYSYILASPPPQLGDYPTEADRFNHSQKFLTVWRALDGHTLDLAALQVDLPFPLRITGTLVVANPEDLRERAGERFARDLAVLSGRQINSATRSAWEREIAAWGATISR